MPRKGKTRRQRKAATAKKNVAKAEQTNQPGKKFGNLESRVNIDENVAKHMNRPPHVSPSEKKELKITTSDKFVKKKAAWELGNALDKYEEQYSSSDSLGTIDDDELLDQIWKDVDEIFPPSMSPNVGWINQSDNLESSDKLVKEKPAQDHGGTSKETRNPRELEDVLDNAKEQCSSSNLKHNFDWEKLDGLLKDLVDMLPFSDGSEAMDGKYPQSVEVREQCGNLIDIILNNKQPTRDEFAKIAAVLSKGLPPHSAWELGNALDEYREQYSKHYKQEDKDEAITYSPNIIQKKAAHQPTETPEGTRNAWELGNALDKDEEQHSSSDLLGIIDNTELHEIWQELNEMFITTDESQAKGGISPTSGGDSGPVPPKFFGDSGYFMLTGTSSQLQHQLKDLEARNIFVESFVELSDAVADIVEQQMTDLVKNRDPILGMMPDKYDLLEPRRVRRRKKKSKKTHD